MTSTTITSGAAAPSLQRSLRVIPGLLVGALLAAGGEYVASVTAPAMGLHKGAISGIMMAIVLGIVVNNTAPMPVWLRPGIEFSVKRVLRLGIVLLGIRLSVVDVGGIGMHALPVIGGTVLSALLLVTWLGRRFGLTAKLGTLIAVGTSICGATAIVATLEVREHAGSEPFLHDG